MVGRFAPSPTGPLHLGSLRTALAAWLWARSTGSRFLVRIEDLDPQRSRAEFEHAQLRDLRALGIDWDGAPLRQSARPDRYAAALAELESAGRVYPCFCSRAEVRAAATAPHGALPEGAYPGTCRALPARERDARIAAGRPYALRVDAGAARIEFSDQLLGVRRGVVDDFVVRRADGVPSYQLAVVVDDAAQEIEQVVRGGDLADSTPRQILLARWLGLPVLEYAHLGLVLGADGARLAKRHNPFGSRSGAVTLAANPFGSRDRGAAVAATLTWLAATLGLADHRPVVTCAAELLDGFHPDRLPAGPVTLAWPGQRATR